MIDKLSACPMCGSRETKLLEDIKVDELDSICRLEYKFSVKHLFDGQEVLSFCSCGKCDLQFFSPMIAGSQGFYENLQKFDWYYFDDKPEFDFATQYVKDNDDVLEIGSGKGAFAKKILSKFYTGLEFSQQAIRFAQKNGVNLVSQSIEDYANDNANKHDVVCNFQVLEHVSDVDSFLRSSVSCLKLGGLMIISVPAADSFSRYVRNFCLDMPPHHLTRWTDLALMNIAKQYDLELEVIHHEKIQDVHKSFYAKTIFLNSFMSLIGRDYSNIDTSFVFKLLGKVSSLLGWIFSKGLVADFLLPRGLSVVAVYRKPEKG